MVGVSERCCFCCYDLSWALDGWALDRRLKFGAISGRVYPWAPPPWISKEAKEFILTSLSSEITLALKRLGAFTGFPDLFPSSDSHNSDWEGGSLGSLDEDWWSD